MIEAREIYSREISEKVSARLIQSKASLAQLRVEVRQFINENLSADYVPGLGVLAGHDPLFSAALGAQGWIGMTLPSKYGGAGRTALERFIVIEELLMAGAPIAAHWAADAQSGPNILRYGSEDQRNRFLPGIARGELYFSLGMSEPESGSDLSSIRTKATRCPGGWIINGTKVWTSNAHLNNHITVLARTGPASPERDDLTQFIVPLPDPGVVVRPIPFLDGSQHFNQVLFTETFVPDSMVLGAVGQGWSQIVSELALERSGPDRYLSTFPVFFEFVRQLRSTNTDFASRAGELLARYRTLRRLSMAVAVAIDINQNPGALAALVKDLGSALEQGLVEQIAELIDDLPDGPSDRLRQVVDLAVMSTPAFSIRGGTTEILHSIIAKGISA